MNLKQQVALDLLVTPGTMLPTVAGGSLLLLSPILGPMAGFFGFVGLIIGIGVALTNVVFRMNSTMEKALKKIRAQEAKERERFLDDLHDCLVSDRDPRDNNALMNLRAIHDSLIEDVDAGRLAGVPMALVEQVKGMFEVCVVQLQKQHELYQTSRKVTGALKEKLQSQRNELIEEIEHTVTTLADVVSEIRTLKLKTNSGQLTRLSTRLTDQLEIAKNVEQRMAELAGEDYLSFDELEQ